ncbi:MAG: P-II family nitrogen regulator [Syntrophobacteraceae bacterium]
MKEVKAYIKPHKLSDVILALNKIEGLTGVSVSNTRGFGRGKAKTSRAKVTEGLVDFLQSIKIEIVCRDDLVEQIVSTIEKAARTGLRGDGKIYVSGVETAVRISTGERGESAI